MRIGKYYELPGLGDYGIAGLKVLVFTVFIVLTWAIINKITSFDDHNELFAERNVCYALERAGLVLGQAVAMTSLISTRSDSSGEDLAWLAGGGVWIMLLLLGVRWLAPKLITFDAGDGAVGNGGGRTVSVGLVRGAFATAAGLVIGAGLSGSAPNLGTALAATLVFTALGIAVLVAVHLGTGWIPPYRLNERVSAGNLGAAFISGGLLVALGLVLHNAIAGDFAGWISGLIGFTLTALIALGVFYLLCLAVDRWIILNATLADVVEGGHEVAAAVVAVALIAIAIGVSAVAI